MKIYIVDAFAAVPYQGNPAAVCILEDAKTEEWMQKVANEMNLSETAFLIKQDASYQLRWFTPKAEVDLCGHATLASAHILWEQHYCNEPNLQFTTKSGLLTVSQDRDWIQMNFPIEAEKPCIPPKHLTDGLRSNYKYVGKNRLDYIVELDHEEDVRNLDPDFSAWKMLDARGVIVTSKCDREGVDFVSRCFYPALGVNEDPVTGSAHCCLGPFWQQRLNNKDELIAEQISARGGILKLKLNPERVIIEGQAVTTLIGELLSDE